MKIDVLGTKYTIRRVNAGQDEYMEKMNFGGYCDGIAKEIVILNLKSTPDWAKESDNRIKMTENVTIRHELVHAFLNESGLQWNTFNQERAWAKNEEMVDWIVLQSPKLFKAFQAAGAL